MPDRPRHFSMIREFQLADLVTLLNGFLGAGALLAFMQFAVERETAYFWLGTALLPVALLMDTLDGRIARRSGMASPLGQELDSLADVVSFGVAPAAMAFAAGMRGGWDALCLIYLRRMRHQPVGPLQRHGRRAVRPHRQGDPLRGAPDPDQPAAGDGAGHPRRPRPLAGPPPLGVVTLVGFRLHPWSLVYVLWGSGMISKTLRIPKP